MILAMVLAGVFVMGLEVAKFSLFVAAKKSRGVVAQTGYYGLAMVLLVLSVLTSVAFFESGTVKGVEQAKRESLAYVQQVKQLNFINEQIALTQKLIKTDADNNYRQRSYEQMTRLNNLYDKHAALSEQLDLIVAPSTGINSVLVSIGSTLHLRTEQVRFFLFFVLAVLIDVSGVACLLFATKSNSENTLTTVIRKRQARRPTANPRDSPAVNHSKNSLTERAEVIANKVLVGAYGESPVVRKIIERERVRHDVVKCAFEHLMAIGKLSKQGKQYVLQT